ncbi:hypothetical protein pb186bvf_003435 [Paramecium bursaria]
MNLEQDNKLLQEKIHQLELIIQGFKLPNFKELQQELKQAYERIFHLENEIEKLKFQLRTRDQEMLAYEKMNVTLPVSITKTGTMNQQIKEACWQHHSTIYADQTIKIATTTSTNKSEQGTIKIQYQFNNVSEEVLSLFGSFAQTFGVKLNYKVLNEPIMKGRVLDWHISAQILDINYELPTLLLKINTKAVSLLVPCSINKIFDVRLQITSRITDIQIVGKNTLN